MIKVIARQMPVNWAVRADHDSVMFSIIKQAQAHFEGKNVLIVSTLWYHMLDNNEKAEYHNPRDFDEVILVSLFDWEDRDLAEKLRKWFGKELIHVGNTVNGYFYSFWASIVYKYMNYKKEDVLPSNFKHKFICYNRKVHRHRGMIAEEIMSRGLDKMGVLTLGDAAYCDITVFPQVHRSIPKLIPSEYTEVQHDKLTGDDDLYNVMNDISTLGNIDLWNSHFLNVVNETRVTNTSIFLSEKVFKPIIGMRPFVVFGDTGTLKFLKYHGFQTFDRWFSEEYDTVSFSDDPRKKINMICDIIENIASKTPAELKSMYKEMYPVLKHNRDHFSKFGNFQFQQGLTNVFDEHALFNKEKL